MGANLSAHLYQSIYEQCTQITTSYVTKKTTQISTNQVGTQIINVEIICGTCGSINVTQSMNNTATAIYQLRNESASNVNNSLTEQLTNAITHTDNQTNTGLANLFQVNGNYTDDQIKTTIMTKIQSSINDTVIQNFSTSVFNKQVLNFNLRVEKMDNLNINQDMIIKQFTQTLLNNITNQLVANASQVTTTNTVTTKTDQSNIGVSLMGLLGFGGFGQFGNIIVVIIVLVVIGGIIGMVIKKKKKNG